MDLIHCNTKLGCLIFRLLGPFAIQLGLSTRKINMITLFFVFQIEKTVDQMANVPQSFVDLIKAYFRWCNFYTWEEQIIINLFKVMIIFFQEFRNKKLFPDEGAYR